MAEIVVSLQTLLELQQRHDNSVVQSGVTGFTWKIHKYLVSGTKPNAEQNGTSSSKIPENDMNQCSSTNKDGNNQGEVRDADLKSFAYNELRDATNNFGSGSFLGDRSYGKVYKGWIDKTTYSPSEYNTGLPVAIKRVDAYNCADQPKLEMLKEFRHPNLEKLIGYCLHGKVLFLVYEFMPNRNFENLLSSGIARGILFLHKTEGDVKGRKFGERRVDELHLGRHKILLDEYFTAKLSGYGVSKLLVHEGYPENTRDHIYPDAGDYYPGFEPVELQTNFLGFTVLLAELVTGKEISTVNESKTIMRRLYGKTSLFDIAKSCFEICNEADSESRILTILQNYVTDMPNGGQSR